MIDLLLSLVLTAYAALLEPTYAHCPAEYVLGGVSPDGRFRCIHDLIGDEHTGWRPPGQVTARVYCEVGTIPIAISEHAVACGKGRYQW